MKRKTLPKIFCSLLILSAVITVTLTLTQKATAQPYIGEIRMVGFNYAPANWAICDGRQLQISDNYALFNIIGTTYGGDGQTTFALPDLRGRVPIQVGTTIVIGGSGGTESVTQTPYQMAAHSHLVAVSSNPGTTVSPINAFAATAQTPDRQPVNAYTTGPATGIASTAMLGIKGGSQPQDTRQPYLGVNYIICLSNGAYPTQS